MAWLYITAFLSWNVVFIYTAPAVWDLLRGRGRYGDIGRLCVFLIAAQVMGFRGYRMATGELTSDHAMVGLLISSVVVAGFTLWTARFYGRGARV